MEPLFENKVVLSKEVYSQFISRVLRMTSRVFLIIGIGILVFTLLGLALTETNSILIGLIVFAAILIFLAMFNARLSANRIYKQQLIIHGQEPENTICFTDTIKGLSSNKGESTYQYDQITKVYETKDLLILMMSKSVALLLRKDGFTIGNLAGFKAFIKEKCPNVKITE